VGHSDTLRRVLPAHQGVPTSIQTFHRQLAALGHEVLLIAPDYGPDTVVEEGVVRLPATTVPLDPEDRLMGLRAARRLAPGLAKRRIDPVHIQTPFVAHYAGVVLADQLGLPRVESYHPADAGTRRTGCLREEHRFPF